MDIQTLTAFGPLDSGKTGLKTCARDEDLDRFGLRAEKRLK